MITCLGSCTYCKMALARSRMRAVQPVVAVAPVSTMARGDGRYRRPMFGSCTQPSFAISLQFCSESSDWSRAAARVSYQPESSYPMSDNSSSLEPYSFLPDCRPLGVSLSGQVSNKISRIATGVAATAVGWWKMAFANGNGLWLTLALEAAVRSLPDLRVDSTEASSQPLRLAVA